MVDKSTSQTLRRGLLVLDYFQGKDAEYSVKEIAKHLDISSTVTFRLVNTLVESGYLEKNVNSGKYRLGFNAYKLGLSADPHFSLQQLALPFLEQVAEKTQETVSMYVVNPLTLNGICITSLESPQEIKFSTPVGTSRSLYRGASKKVMLAFMEPPQQEQVFQRAIADGFTDIDELKKDLEKIKTDGFAHSESEVYKGAVNVSVPILSSNGRILAGISITFPVFRKEKDTVTTFSKYLIDAAKQIENSLEVVM
ncbi:IclR family transcriptional regulator [Halobacillus sp. A5]|uniref:IclR family transcriptional regulator n=1 Tax=Halobacillus sp. A5 TaxID=2880263 RepID=UPI0020A69052|nr:IclR family transcriptional regulator [Halobacillus sp. A5]MCP3028345.1 IclR family transcriptional regulator [Halobacillus sp. A5]